jgi:glycosyltransferase involved in cell wall biosynthesis
MIKIKELLNISVIIPTYNRQEVLIRTLKSISNQDYLPAEIIIIDASEALTNLPTPINIQVASKIIHVPAQVKGAASQRNQGIELASHAIIGFFDDDILLEDQCLHWLYQGIVENTNCGGVSALITNQSYHSLGMFSRLFYRLLGADTSKSLAGKCIGPAVTFLPENNPQLPNYVEMQWLNAGCTLYRRKALPNPVFDTHFTGYSLMEDLALSLRVRKKWILLNATKSKIFHDSQFNFEKNSILINSEMELVNRYYIMKYLLNKDSMRDRFQLILQQVFNAIASRQILIPDYWKGKIEAFKKIKYLND